jgi:hypothetical protein
MIWKHRRIHWNLVWLIVLTFILLVCLPVAADQTSTGGDNLTTSISTTTAIPSAPYITIDPIGNHTAGDVFFINGTTNLPTGVNIAVVVVGISQEGSGEGSDLNTTVLVTPGKRGINSWSCKITPDLWLTTLSHNGKPQHEPKDFMPGVFFVIVDSPDVANKSYFAESPGFFIFANTSATTQATPSPLPPVLPLVALSGIAVMNFICHKRG